jgi:hypothetical protein
MKKTIFFLTVLLILISNLLFAQSTHTITFEAIGVGAEWDWTVSENADNPPLEFISNPVSGGINSTATVAKFTARQTGNPWALCFTNDDGEFTFDATNSIVKMMVYKPETSNIAIKFEGISPPVEISNPNTVANQWEEITFDFSASIGNTYNRIVIIPDFQARTQDNIIYFDNIQVPNGVVAEPMPEPTTLPPVPTHEEEDVISIYSDTYENITGTDFNPNWGQSTTVTVDYDAAGNNTLKYENLNYQGTQFANQDVSGYDYLHVDFWTPNATSLDFYLISPGAEINYSLPIETETWVSVNIPLTDFVPPVNLANVIQFKVVGNNIVYFDNWYFWKNPIVSGTDATLSDLQVDGETINSFSPLTINYVYGLLEGTVTIPQITTATPNDSNAESVVINQASAIPGDATVVVTAEDGITTKTYTVSYAITIPNSLPPVPTHAQGDVISLFSDAYNDVPVDTWLTAWSQATLEEISILANPVKKYSSLNFAGIETTGSNLINVTGMSHFHIDIWTPDTNDFKVKLVDWGADGAWGGGDDTEHEVIYSSPQTGSWISYDIALTDFVNLNITGNMAQYILSKGPLGTIYVDNMYFYNQLDTPANVQISTTSTEITITWDAVVGATSYIVKSCDTPYGTYELDETGVLQDNSWTAPISGAKKFYQIIASDEIAK